MKNSTVWMRNRNAGNIRNIDIYNTETKCKQESSVRDIKLTKRKISNSDKTSFANTLECCHEWITDPPFIGLREKRKEGNTRIVPDPIATTGQPQMDTSHPSIPSDFR